MIPSPPSDALHFRGKTLTPESPRPVHIPEPSNIPVLEKQIDPIFNLMSTHMEPPHALRDLTAMDYEMARNIESDQHLDTSSAVGNDHGLNHSQRLQNEEAALEHKHDGTESVEKVMMADVQEHPQSIITESQLSSLADQPSTSAIPHDTLPTPAQIQTEPTYNIFPSDVRSQHVIEPYEPTQDSFLIQGQSTSSPANLHDTDHRTNLHLQTDEAATEDVSGGGVNFQTLLDNISPSNAVAPSAEHAPLGISASPPEQINVSDSSSANPLSAILPSPAGLPPRPPPQEKPAIHPNYTPGEDIRSYHYPHILQSKTHSNFPPQPSNSYRPSQGYPNHSIVAAGAPGTSSAPNGLLPPPLATFQQNSRTHEKQQDSPSAQPNRQKDTPGNNIAGSVASAGDDAGGDSWGVDIQQKYDQFLSDERTYVAEGLWDRFPPGSRLFVGNLPTEIVNKRDLFLIFHKYGKLAQLSIKQAYGFVQYLDAQCCHNALQGEQAMTIKGRKMHLEISKPQKNSRNAAPTAAGDNLRASYSRRSRSPDYGRVMPSRGTGQRSAGDRYDKGVVYGDFRDEPRRGRDDYRPMRSPSPRGYRARDEYRGSGNRSPNRYYGGRRSRSRSPVYGRGGRYRSLSPRRHEVDDDATLPIPRRDARDVPDVQIILIEELDRAFVTYIEKSFRERGLRCGVLFMPRVSLAAVVKRQILEGVQAVVKLYRMSQNDGKIPLQVFDRSGGADNVRFEEYDHLEANIAAELVIRAKSTHGLPGVSQPQPPYQYPTPAQPFGTTQFGQPPQRQPVQQQQQPQSQLQPQPAPMAAQPDLASLITSLDGPALQKLLGAMANNPQNPQNPQTPETPQQHAPQQMPTQSQDLTSLFGTAPQHQLYQYPPPPQQQQQQQQPQQQPQPIQQPSQANTYGVTSINQGFNGNHSLSSFLSTASNHPTQQVQHHQQQSQPGQQQHVQNLMEQLARWKQ